MNRLNKEVEDYLRANFMTMNYRQMASHLGVSKTTVAIWVMRLRLKREFGIFDEASLRKRIRREEK